MQVYNELITALRNTGIPFAEYAWDKAPVSGPYGVIALDSEAAAVWADNHQQEQALQGSIDLFVRGSSGRDYMTQVQQALDSLEVSWQLNEIMYERTSHIIHYEWIFELEAV